MKKFKWHKEKKVHTQKDLSAGMSTPVGTQQQHVASCTKKFSVAHMTKLFNKCVSIDDAEKVDLTCYIEAWQELIMFLNSLGTGFSFIGSDVVEKCGHLKDLQNKTKDGYLTVESMVLFEKENDLIQYKGKSAKPVLSGSRTLLRLHRALIFLKMFFDKVCESSDENAKVSTMCYEAYHASPMAKYHPWLIRKAVGVAVHILPSKKTFTNQLCQNDLTHDQIYENLRICSNDMNMLYQYTEKIYQKHDLMELP